MPEHDVRRERRALLAFGLLAGALVLAGLLAAAVLSAGEPRRGEGLVPPPAQDGAGQSEDPAADPETGQAPFRELARGPGRLATTAVATNSAPAHGAASIEEVAA